MGKTLQTVYKQVSLGGGLLKCPEGRKVGNKNMMLQEMIRNKIENAMMDVIDGYDFEDIIEEALEDVDLESLVFDALDRKIRDTDFTDVIHRMVQNSIEDVLDDIDLEELIEDML